MEEEEGITSMEVNINYGRSEVGKGEEGSFKGTIQFVSISGSNKSCIEKS